MTRNAYPRRLTRSAGRPISSASGSSTAPTGFDGGVRRMDPSSINLPGAVDLGALAARSSAAASPDSSGSTATAVVDVTEATFQGEVLEKSREVPVVID